MACVAAVAAELHEMIKNGFRACHRADDEGRDGGCLVAFSKEQTERQKIQTNLDEIHDTLAENEIVLQISVELVDFYIVFVRTPQNVIKTPRPVYHE